MSRHRQLLKDYFFRVTEDLLARGVIARKSGQSVEELLRRELATVLTEVEGDVLTVATELGLGLVQSASTALEKLLRGEIDKVARAGRSVMDDFLKTTKPVKKR